MIRSMTQIVIWELGGETQIWQCRVIWGGPVVNRYSGCVYRDSGRLTNMAETCMNKAIFKWAYRLAMQDKNIVKNLQWIFYNNIGKNHLSNITNELVFSSIKDDLTLVLSEHFEIIWFAN